MTKPTDAETIAKLREVAKTNDHFYTPENKEAMDNWIKAQSSTMPTGIALVVGFNYAIRQMQRILDNEMTEEHSDAG